MKFGEGKGGVKVDSRPKENIQEKPNEDLKDRPVENSPKKYYNLPQSNPPKLLILNGEGLLDSEKDIVNRPDVLAYLRSKGGAKDAAYRHENEDGSVTIFNYVRVLVDDCLEEYRRRERKRVLKQFLLI